MIDILIAVIVILLFPAVLLSIAFGLAIIFGIISVIFETVKEIALAIVEKIRKNKRAD